MLSSMFGNSMYSFWVEANSYRFSLSFVYICIAVGDLVIKGPIHRFKPSRFCLGCLWFGSSVYVSIIQNMMIGKSKGGKLIPDALKTCSSLIIIFSFIKVQYFNVFAHFLHCMLIIIKLFKNLISHSMYWYAWLSVYRIYYRFGINIFIHNKLV